MSDFKLIKDLPSLSAGAIFRLTENEKGATYWCIYEKENRHKGWRFDKEVVEKNPEWFSKVE